MPKLFPAQFHFLSDARFATASHRCAGVRRHRIVITSLPRHQGFSAKLVASSVVIRLIGVEQLDCDKP